MDKSSLFRVVLAHPEHAQIERVRAFVVAARNGEQALKLVTAQAPPFVSQYAVSVERVNGPMMVMTYKRPRPRDEKDGHCASG